MKKWYGTSACLVFIDIMTLLRPNKMGLIIRSYLWFNQWCHHTVLTSTSRCRTFNGAPTWPSVIVITHQGNNERQKSLRCPAYSHAWSPFVVKLLPLFWMSAWQWHRLYFLYSQDTLLNLSFDRCVRTCVYICMRTYIRIHVICTSCHEISSSETLGKKRSKFDLKAHPLCVSLSGSLGEY